MADSQLAGGRHNNDVRHSQKLTRMNSSVLQRYTSYKLNGIFICTFQDKALEKK